MTKLQIALNALERISNPVAWEQKHLPKDCRLDGHALLRLIEGAEYYRSAAKQALAKIREQK